MPKIDYVVRETASNLSRNLTISLATVLTVVVSLALVGASLMLRQGVQNATRRWQGGIEFVVFMNPTADSTQTQTVAKDLKSNPQIQRFTYMNQKDSYNEFKHLFSNDKTLVESVDPSELPPSFRVVPVDKSDKVIQQLGKHYQSEPGVKEVSFASATIRAVQELSQRLTVGIIVVALVLLGAAILLILNTIRMAMFARRREIEVMKLVGATNWFIRVPFMLEGLVQGVVGAIVAVLALASFRPFFQSWLPSETTFPLVSGFVLSTGEVITIYTLMIVTGCLVGVVGAGVAVTRFLDV
jgi:cell division transport system permease protein